MVGDPFRPTSGLVVHLRLRAGSLGASGGAVCQRDRLLARIGQATPPLRSPGVRGGMA